MLVGIFTPFLDTMSGGERYILTIASILAQQNEVTIFWDKNDEIKFKNLSKEKLGINIDKVSFDEDIFALPIAERLKKSRKYDKIIYLSDGSLPSVATNLYVHFQFPVEWVKPSFFTKLKARKVKRIFCNSEFTKKYIDKKFGVKSIVLYPPVDLLDSSGSKENKILNVGRLNKLEDETYFKRQDVLINEFKKIIDSGVKDWKLVLVISTKNKSDENDLEDLQKKSEKYPIKILHNPSNTILRNEYISSKIYWHAAGFGQDLSTHPEWAEHFGITTVEAMSAGAVPVVFNAGGQVEIVKSNDTGFLWNTLDELKNSTLDLINNEKKRIELAINAEVKSKDFSEDKFKEKLLQVLL